MPSTTRTRARMAASPKDDIERQRKERKRAIDRAAQREHRKRQREYVEHLESQLAMAKQGSASDQVARLLRENEQLRNELESLRAFWQSVQGLVLDRREQTKDFEPPATTVRSPTPDLPPTSRALDSTDAESRFDVDPVPKVAEDVDADAGMPSNDVDPATSHTAVLIPAPEQPRVPDAASGAYSSGPAAEDTNVQMSDTDHDTHFQPFSPFLEDTASRLPPLDPQGGHLPSPEASHDAISWLTSAFGMDAMDLPPAEMAMDRFAPGRAASSQNRSSRTDFCSAITDIFTSPLKRISSMQQAPLAQANAPATTHQEFGTRLAPQVLEDFMTHTTSNAMPFSGWPTAGEDAGAFIASILKSPPLEHFSSTIPSTLVNPFNSRPLISPRSRPPSDDDLKVRRMLQRARAQSKPPPPPTLESFIFNSPDNTLASDLKEYLEPMQRKGSITEYLGTYWVLYLFLRWIVKQDEESYFSIPAWLRPKDWQLALSQPSSIDFISWPQLRNEIAQISAQDPVRAEQIMTDIGLHMVVKLPFSERFILYGNEAEFHTAISELENWAIKDSFFDRFPQWRKFRPSIANVSEPAFVISA